MTTSVENTATELRDQDDPDAGSTYLVAIIGTILFLASTVFAIWLFNTNQLMENESKLYAPKPREIAELQTEQLARISDVRWVDETAGVVAIPVDQAIPLFVKRVKAGAPVSPTKIPSATPSSPSAPAGAAPSATQPASSAAPAAAAPAASTAPSAAPH